MTSPPIFEAPVQPYVVHILVLSKYSMASVAPLQQHVKCIVHAAAQVCRAAGHKQGAELQRGGHAVLVDVRQEVFLALIAQDDLGVIVVEVHLREKRAFSNQVASRQHFSM